ncbi:MAG TPA: serine--tRNA ligase, partial [Clostridiales bacterium]|nr:serine--tRNA ligase [Clostridiales bacterium]
MLDIKKIKENPVYVKERLASRNQDFSDEIDGLLALDEERRALIRDTETKKASQNLISRKIPAMKKAGEDVSAIFTEMKEISDIIKADTDKIAIIEKEIENTLLGIPNLPHASLPVGQDDSANREIRRWGEPTKFDFEPKPHWELGQTLGMLDPDRAAKVTGTRFHFTVGMGAKLE